MLLRAQTLAGLKNQTKQKSSAFHPFLLFFYPYWKTSCSWAYMIWDQDGRRDIVVSSANWYESNLTCDWRWQRNTDHFIFTCCKLKWAWVGNFLTKIGDNHPLFLSSISLLFFKICISFNKRKRNNALTI